MKVKEMSSRAVRRNRRAWWGSWRGAAGGSWDTGLNFNSLMFTTKQRCRRPQKSRLSPCSTSAQCHSLTFQPFTQTCHRTLFLSLCSVPPPIPMYCLLLFYLFFFPISLFVSSFALSLVSELSYLSQWLSQYSSQPYFKFLPRLAI